MKRSRKQRLVAFLVAICLLCSPVSSKWIGDSAVIKAYAASPSISKKTVSINKGFDYTLKMLHISKKANVVWSTSNPSVAAIKVKKGTCTVIGKKTGKATITAKVNKKKYKCRVTVKGKPVLSPSSKSIEKGKTFTLTLKDVASGSIKWSSSSSKILKIYSKNKNECKVKALKTGKATVKAVYRGKTYQCKVTVKKPAPHPKLSFTSKRYTRKQVKSGETFSMKVNNKIKKVTVSKKGVLSTYGSSSTKRYFTALDPGTVTVTIYDIYNQKITSKVTVTQEVDTATLTGARSRTSLPVPRIDAVYHTSDEITVKALGNTHGNEPYDGYEYYLSTSKSFNEKVEIRTPCNSYMENQKERMDVTFRELSPSAIYYVKVRSFAIEGRTKVYGSWSPAWKVVMNNNKKKLSSKPVYSYDMFFVDSTGPELYTECYRAFYIKTNNPDPSSIEFVVSGPKKYLILESSYNMFEDIQLLDPNDYRQCLKKVKGGYVGYTWTDIPGDYTVEVRECSNKGYTVAKKVTWTVKEYEKAKDDWIQSLIDTYTTPSMDPFEKMQAVCNYLLTPGLFKYLTISNGKIVSLAAMPNAPFFKSFRWDSAISPSVLCEIAEKIGGFDDIHNCFLDYPPGSMQWYYTHYFVKLTIGDRTERYQACPPSSTGDVGDIKYIDFSDTSKMSPAD